ncbi:MAG: cell division protein FtsZ [Bacteroidetes bacterium]|nr:cell division protein FtsZ [Bacteroidota bacterium]
MLRFDDSGETPSIIKVIGVGGGGSNAVTHMFKMGIQGVEFLICNTDVQAMKHNPITNHIQLGVNLTGGLGAGAIPSVGKNAAIESIDEIRRSLQGNTRMVFITAGMGGGTGTGAAPVIAAVAKELDILTVGIVTLPFSFEGRKRRCYAEEGINELKKHVDALIVICNDKLREVYGNLKLSDAFSRADNVLTNAAKGIAEIITVVGHINVDFEDVKTVMKDSGVALMGTGSAEGEDRALRAVEEAINSPLLNDSDIEGASNILLYISSGEEEISMDEVTEITDFIQLKTKNTAEVIWGSGRDERLGNRINITLIATGFDKEHRIHHADPPQKIKVGTLYEEAPEKQPEVQSDIPAPQQDAVNEITLIHRPAETAEPPIAPPEKEWMEYKPIMPQRKPEVKPDPVVQEPDPVTTTPLYTSAPPSREPLQPRIIEPNDLDRRTKERVDRLRTLSFDLKNRARMSIDELESIPAYKRRNVEFAEVPASDIPLVSRMTLSKTEENGAEIHTDNSFLHDNVD